MQQYKVITATGEQYIIKVDEYTVNKLVKDNVIVKYESL